MDKDFRKNLPFIFNDDELIKPGIAVNSEKIENIIKDAREREFFNMKKKKNDEIENIENIENIRINTIGYADSFDVGIRIGLFDNKENLIKGFIVKNPKVMKFDEKEIYSLFKSCANSTLNEEPTLENVSPDWKALYKEALDNLNSQQVVIESYKRVIKDLLDMYD